MYFICTGKPPFQPNSQIEVNDDDLFLLKLQSYQESPTFAEMVDFIRQLMVVNVDNRMTAAEALRHPWLNASPYQHNRSLRRLQTVVVKMDELTEVPDQAESQSSDNNAAAYHHNYGPLEESPD